MVVQWYFLDFFITYILHRTISGRTYKTFNFNAFLRMRLKMLYLLIKTYMITIPQQYHILGYIFEIPCKAYHINIII